MSCSTSKIVGSQECDCDYIPPEVENILVRKNKKGEYQIKINGKGKWISANFNKETKTITFFA